MTSTLAQIAMILTVAAPLQAAPQPATTQQQNTELQTEIASLKESLAEANLDPADAVTKIDAMYNRALFWMLTLFGVLVAAITILAILICAVLPLIAARNERERQDRSDKALAETQEALKTAQANLANMQAIAEEKLITVEQTLTEKIDTDSKALDAKIDTDRQALEAKIGNDRQELEARIDADRKKLETKIERASNIALGGRYELDGDMQAKDGRADYAIFLYIFSAGYYIDGDSIYLAAMVMNKASNLEWTAATLDADSTDPTATWRFLDSVIDTFAQDTSSDVVSNILPRLQALRKQFGPEATPETEPEAADAPDDEQPTV